LELVVLALDTSITQTPQLKMEFVSNSAESSVTKLALGTSSFQLNNVMIVSQVLSIILVLNNVLINVSRQGRSSEKR
jgi:hypothetical protein